MILASGNFWAAIGLTRRKAGLKKVRGPLVVTGIMGISLPG